MIQPLRPSRTSWFVYWIDLEEPVPLGGDFYLPTLLVVCNSDGTPIAPPEVMEELDQLRVENFLLRLFDEHGSPDLLSVATSPDWNEEDWKAFSQENHLELHFQPFEQPSELQKLVKSVVFRYTKSESNAPTPRQIADGLLQTALRVRSPRKKRTLLTKAVEICADCAGARVELADLHFQDGDWKAAATCYDDVIARQRQAIPSAGKSGWENRGNRPLLRSYYGRAMTLWHQGSHAEAARQFEHLISLNPQDNQGARFFLPMLYLLAEEPEAAAEYLERYQKAYPDDYGEPSFLFGWALSLFLEGRETEAKALYRRGILKNIYVAPMLLELQEPRRTLWHPNDRAEPGYAAEFIESYAVLWDRETGALRLLREAWEEAQADIREIQRKREVIADLQDQRYEPNYKKLWQALIEEEDEITSRPERE